jgi:small subunit ribosomal protein S6
LLRDYEILYIVRPDLDDEQVHGAVGSVDKLIANLGGTTVKTDIWGRRRLAYEVRHLREGQYVLTDFRIDPGRVPEMEATLKISDTVFRHLIVRKPEPARNGKPKPAAAEPVASATEAAGEVAVETAPAPERPVETAGEVPAEPAPASEPSAEASSEVPAPRPASQPAAEKAPAEEPER